MNRIEIARQYVDELLRQRQDIIAVWVGGSVARGEETALSDIDLQLMAAGAALRGAEPHEKRRYHDLL